MNAASGQVRVGVLVVATWSSTTALLPVFMVGALAVAMREQVNMTPGQVGLAVGVFFASSAGTAAPAGRYIQRVGPRRGLVLSSLSSTAGASGLALCNSWWHVLAILSAAGGINSIAQLAGDLLIAEAVPQARHGLGWGIKTSCAPAAAIVAGIAVPVAGDWFGWRATFVGAAGLAVAQLVMMRAVPTKPPVLARARSTRLPALRRLLVLGAAGGLAVGATNALSVFYVDAAVAGGLATSVAGIWLAVGGASAVAARVMWGSLADRMLRGHLTLMGVLCLVGAAGALALASAPSGKAWVVATVVAFAAGGGWNPLLPYALFRLYPEQAAAANGVALSGTMAGSVLGPVAFGGLADYGGYGVAWLATGAMWVAAAALLLAGRPRRA